MNIKISEKELKDWFWSKFDDCYSVYYDMDTRPYYMYYDSKVIRQMKLCKVSGNIFSLSDNTPDPSGICLFNKDHNDGHLYLTKTLFTVIENNYRYRWEDNKNLINSWLYESKNSLISTSQFGGAFAWESGMYDKIQQKI